jgi:transcriptional regulator with XRE-family HTH domain
MQVQMPAYFLHTVSAMPAPNPTMLRRQLGAELRRQRERAQRTVAEIAKELGWSESKLSRIETASTGIRETDLGRLLTAYEVSDSERARITALAGMSRQRAWWEAYGDALLDPLTTFIGFEAEASAIYGYECQVVQGLLQTGEYARAIVEIMSVGERPDVIEQRVAARMARQTVLTRQPPPQLCAILDEAVLRRPVGGNEVMQRQLMRLLEVSRQPSITIQVLPFAVGAHRGVDGSFVILEFPDDVDRPLAYSEGMTGGVIRSRSDDLRRYWMSLEALRSAALPPQESTEFIAEVMRAYA